MPSKFPILDLNSAPTRLDLGGTIRILHETLQAKDIGITVGQFHAGEKLVRHYHVDPVVEVYFVLRGKGTLLVEDEAIDLVPGRAVMVPPRQVHSLENNGQEFLEVLFLIIPRIPDHLVRV